MRSFIALDLPDSLRLALTRLQGHLPLGRPVPAENLHLTLAFLDDQPAPALAELAGALDRKTPTGFDLRLTGLDTFGGRSPKLIHATAAPDPALTALHDIVLRAARRAGIVLPRARFRPHVTLARFGAGLSSDDQQRLARFIARHGLLAIPPARAGSFSLFSSTLHKDGPVYDTLATWALAAEPG